VIRATWTNKISVFLAATSAAIGPFTTPLGCRQSQLHVAIRGKLPANQEPGFPELANQDAGFRKIFAEPIRGSEIRPNSSYF